MLEHICGYCQKVAKFVCMRCSVEYYCSKNCQLAAFPQHRRDCFSLPSLKIVDGDKLSPQKSNNSFDLDDSDKISIAGLVKPQEIEITKEVKVLQNGNVESTKKEEVQVEKVVPNDLKPKETITPAFNQGVRTVPPKEYSNKTPSVVSMPKQSAKVEEPPKLVEKNVQNAEPVRQNKQNAEPIHQNAEPVRQNNQKPIMTHPMRKAKPKETRLFIHDLRIRPLPNGKYKVKIVNGSDNPKLFYVMESLDAVDAFMGHIESNIEELVKNDKSGGYKPLKDEMVLAKFEGVYYRALVEDISVDKSKNQVYDVFFVDYGNYSQVKEEEIRPFSQILKNEIILNPVFFQNFPSTVSAKLEAILSDENGFDIMVESQAEDYYVASILGI